MNEATPQDSATKAIMCTTLSCSCEGLLTGVIVLAAMDCAVHLKQRGCGCVTALGHIDNCVHDRQVLISSAVAHDATPASQNEFLKRQSNPG
eukprot:6062872-Amphidinium_carterae.3